MLAKSVTKPVGTATGGIFESGSFGRHEIGFNNAHIGSLNRYTNQPPRGSRALSPVQASVQSAMLLGVLPMLSANACFADSRPCATPRTPPAKASRKLRLKWRLVILMFRIPSERIPN